MNPSSFIGGLQFVVNQYLPKVQVQAKRHKRKSSRRWQKKWLKRFGTTTVTKCIRMGNTVYVSPEIYEGLKKKIKEKTE